MEKDIRPLLESLRRELAAHQRALEEGQAVVEREQKYCEHLRGLIELETIQTAPPRTHHQNNGASNNPNPAASPASVLVVKRQPGYAAVSVTQAARQILGTTDKLHADELVRRIFVIDSPKKFQRAKNGLVSELVRGTKAGHFVRTGPNEFALPNSH
jgi:hypothetical protein